uniref:Family with sequence similarity 163 member A n=1 Tax=Neogobius melanostomus TaxID=47308 RepID=A0A8C6SNI6_9GOBI
MTAGTVVITGGILATVILLCIIAVLCYCRLQYYCCKNNGSDSGSLSQQHFACNACSASGLDGSVSTPLSLSPPEEPPGPPPAPPPPPPLSTPLVDGRGTAPPAPLQLPVLHPQRGERVTYMPTHYENPALATPLPAVPIRGSMLRSATRSQPLEFYTNTRAISTEV